MLKQFIKNIFSAMGLEVRKKIHTPLNDAISYNSQVNADFFYSDEKLVASYISADRISFYKELIKMLEQQLDFKNIHTIADVSSGTGHLLKLLQEKHSDKKYFGFEYSNKALIVCRKTCPDIPFAQADLYKGVAQTFDLLLCVDTLEHLEYPEKAICNMLNMLGSGGYVCIAVPNGRYDKFEGHIHYWSPESFILFLNRLNRPSGHTGCEVIYSYVLNKYIQQFVIIQKK